MRSNYKRLGDYIRQVDVRNVDAKEENLLGVSTQKFFIPSIANTVGTDFSRYKVVKHRQFTYVPDTSRRGDRIGIALLQDYDEGLVSNVYTVFEIIDTTELLPEYLMLWFMRPEFDRYARFMSHGSVREIFGWDEMCDVTLPVPDIKVQQQIVDEYNVVKKRIDLNERLIKTLEETAQAVYKQWFVDFDFPDENGNPYKTSGGKMIDSELGEIPDGWRVGTLSNVCDVKGGKRLPKGSALTSTVTMHPYIKVASLGKNSVCVKDNAFEYIDETTFSSINRYVVSFNDIILSIVGTIGLVSMIGKSLDNANLTENCVKLTKIALICKEYLYCFLNSSSGQNDIVTKTVGGVQGKLPICNIERIKLLIPSERIIEKYEMTSRLIFQSIETRTEAQTLLDTLSNILLSKLSTVEG